jgi:hypothetical protein
MNTITSNDILNWWFVARWTMTSMRLQRYLISFELKNTYVGIMPFLYPYIYIFYVYVDMCSYFYWTIQPRLFIPTGPFSLVYVFRPAHLAGRNKLPATPPLHAIITSNDILNWWFVARWTMTSMCLQRHLISFELKNTYVGIMSFLYHIYLWICVHISILNRKQYYVITLRKRWFQSYNVIYIHQLTNQYTCIFGIFQSFCSW